MVSFFAALMSGSVFFSYDDACQITDTYSLDTLSSNLQAIPNQSLLIDGLFLQIKVKSSDLQISVNEMGDLASLLL
jgi:hypothetical protein